MSFFKLSHPERITSLEFELDPKIQCIRFPSLITVTCNAVMQLDHESLEKLLDRKHLKTAYLNLRPPQYLSEFLEPKSLVDLKYLYHYLWGHFLKKNEQFKKLKLFINCVQVTFKKKWKDLNFRKNYTTLLMENPPDEPLLSFLHVDYLQHTNDYCEPDFFDQMRSFPNLQSVFANVDIDKQVVFSKPHFTRFLETCSGLRRLVSANRSLNNFPFICDNLVLFI